MTPAWKRNTQLLVPKNCMKMIFQVAHYNPIAENMTKLLSEKWLILLAGQPPECASVVGFLPEVSAGHSKSASVPITINGYPV